MNVLLLDGTALAYRSYYAFARNPLRTTSGEETSLTFAFVNTLLHLLERFPPRWAAVVFDAPGRTFRHQIDPQYKAGRPPMPQSMLQQLPRLHETLSAFRLPVLQIEGFEADDVIGTLARRFEARDAKVFLVSADKDFQQLLSEHVRIVRLRRTANDLDEVGPEELHDELGIAPNQVVDFMALCGDSTDNVPGIPGIGQKTAGALIRAHGSLEGVFENLERVARPALRRKLQEGRASAVRSRDLVRIVTDVPLDADDEALRWSQPDWQRVRRILRQLEFFKLLRMLPSAARERPPDTVSELVEKAPELQALAGALQQSEAVALHVETSPGGPAGGEVIGVALAAEPHRAHMVAVAAPPPQLGLGGLGLEPPRSGEIDMQDVRSALGGLLADARTLKIGHDVKRLARLLGEHGITLAGPLFDTMVASYVLNPARRQHTLEDLASECLDERLGSPADLFDRHHRERDVRSVPRDRLAAHACAHAAAALRLHGRLRAMLEAEGLAKLFDEVEMPLVRVLLDMEVAGVRVDVPQLEELSNLLEARSDALAERIYRLRGQPFNINSPRQLGEVLFGELGLPHGRRTKTGWSTDVDVLERLAREHDLPRLVLEYRQLVKLRSTYSEALPRLVCSRTGRIHTSFNQAVASTGRLSSSDPNLQNIPIRTELGRRIRCAFVPGAPDAQLVSADYSQIELRILAHLSQDRALMQAFRDRADVHTLTAARIAGCDPRDVTPQQRSAAKTVNFAVIYGMGARGLAQQLGIPVDEARRFIEEYFAGYPGVRRYTQEVIERARAQGFVATLLGRRLQLPDLHSSHPAQRAFAERVAVNAPIQGSAADLIKVAMVRVHRALGERGLRARMILQVHDELLFEAPEPEIPDLTELVRHQMENAMRLAVPIVVELGVGHSWSEAH